ncbi:hypothetical protein NFJ02_06g129400 [Pycnococcus provasolii]
MYTNQLLCCTVPWFLTMDTVLYSTTVRILRSYLAGQPGKK